MVHIDLPFVRIAEINSRSPKNHGRKPDGIFGRYRPPFG
jgi:hypothetical protein